MSHTDGRAASRAEDVGMLRACFAAEDGSLSLIAFPRVITTFRECLLGLLHEVISFPKLLVVLAITAPGSIRVAGASEDDTHEHAQDEGNQGNDDNGLDIRVDHHVETP